MSSDATTAEPVLESDVPSRRLGLGTVGPLPTLLFVVLAAVILTAGYLDRLPADMIGGFAVIMALGWLLGAIGGRAPIVRDLGGPAILSLFAPSAMVAYHLMNPALLHAITAVMKTDNFLYFYIASLVCGSILGMDRRILVQGFLRIAPVLVCCEMATFAVAIAVGLLLGFSPGHTFFYIIAPIMGGGIGEGVLPYSAAMGEILKQPQALLISQLIPAAVLGNLFAIILSGLARRLGEKKPEHSGGGQLVRAGSQPNLSGNAKADKPVEFELMGAGMILACSFYIFGLIVARFTWVPAPIAMILSAAIVKYLRVMPQRMELGAYQMYRFVAANLTWPLLAGLGVLYVPWAEVVSAITPGFMVVCAIATLTTWVTGFFVGRFARLFPVEAAMVAGCHTGLGGTGDVAILSAGGRIGLMPFAQAATRIGGAFIVLLATFLLKLWHH